MHKFFILLFILSSCNNSNNETRKIQTPPSIKVLKDTTIQVIWREWKYDSVSKDTNNTIILNDQYFKNISDQEKAAIGYIATFTGSECWWDGDAKPDSSNLICKVINALGLGYQCSDTHLKFLQQWFRKSDSILKELRACPIIPMNAWEQNTFYNLKIHTNIDTIKIQYEADDANMKERKFYHWTEEISFKASQDNLFLISRKRKINP